MHLIVDLSCIARRVGKTCIKEQIEGFQTYIFWHWHRFASIAKLAGDEMEPYVAQLIPKLYRYRFCLCSTFLSYLQKLPKMLAAQVYNRLSPRKHSRDLNPTSREGTNNPTRCHISSSIHLNTKLLSAHQAARHVQEDLGQEIMSTFLQVSI